MKKSKSKFVQVAIERTIHERLVALHEGSGFAMFRILGFALLEWEHKHATPDSLMGQAVAKLNKKESV